MKEIIEYDFEKILKENNNVKEIVNTGNIIIPLSLLRNMILSFEEKEYLSYYYIFNKNIHKADIYFKKENNKLKKIKKHLCKLGYIKKVNRKPNGLKRQTILNSHSGNKCEWCNNECYVLQKHHFPVSSKDGGKDVVYICPNCHYTYHSLESDEYE